MDAKSAPNPNPARTQPASANQSDRPANGSGPLVAVALLSSCCLAWSGPQWPGSSLAAALIPWVLLSGLPCAGMRTGELALALPACAAAARLDWAQGVAGLDLLRVGAVGFALCLLLAHAAKLASSGSRNGSPASFNSWAHALLWWLMVPVAPALGILAQLDGGVAAGAAQWLTSLGPVAWLLSPTGSVAMPLAGAALVWGFAAGKMTRRSGPMAVLVAMAVPAAAQHSALVPMEVVLEGPLESCTATLVGGGRTHLRLSLSTGERVQLELPMDPGPLLPGDAVPADAPTFEVQGAGSVSFAGWSSALDKRWRALPSTLRNRSRPPRAGDRVRPHPGLMPLLLAGALLGWTMRRKPVRSLIFGVLAGAGLWGLPPRVEAGGAAILEGDTEASIWIEVEGRRGGLTVQPGQLLRLERGSGEPLAWRVEGERAGSLMWSVEGQANLLLFTERADLGALSSERNDCLDLSEFWIRGSGLQKWWSGGPWPRFKSMHELGLSNLGEGGPEERTSTGIGAPPGWLVSGLPMGRGILLGRAEPNLGRAERASAGTWLRLTGFE